MVVLRPEGEGVLDVVEASSDDGYVLAGILPANRRRKRIIVPNLFLYILFVVLHAHFAVGPVSEGPVDHANPIIGLWILGLQLDVALVVGLGLFKFLGVEGLAAHLEEHGADTINGRSIVGILFENFLELRDRLFATREVFLGGRAGNIQAGVGSGQIPSGIQPLRIRLLGLLEIFNRRSRLAVLEGGYSVFERTPAFQL